MSRRNRRNRGGAGGATTGGSAAGNTAAQPQGQAPHTPPGSGGQGTSRSSEKPDHDAVMAVWNRVDDFFRRYGLSAVLIAWAVIKKAYANKARRDVTGRLPVGTRIREILFQLLTEATAPTGTSATPAAATAGSAATSRETVAPGSVREPMSPASSVADRTAVAPEPLSETVATAAAIGREAVSPRAGVARTAAAAGLPPRTGVAGTAARSEYHPVLALWQMINPFRRITFSGFVIMTILVFIAYALYQLNDTVAKQGRGGVAQPVAVSAPAEKPAPAPAPIMDVRAPVGWNMVAPEQERAEAAAAGAKSDQLYLVTRYKKIRGEDQPQELTYVEAGDGRTYTGPKEPGIQLEPGYTWGRVEVAARDTKAPNDPSRSVWVKVWVPVPKQEESIKE